LVGDAAAIKRGLKPRQLARAQAGADRRGGAWARAFGPAQRVVDRPGRDAEAVGQSGGRGALGAGLDDLAAFVVGQFAMVAHVKFTFLFLANFLQAPRLPVSAEAGGLESVSMGLPDGTGCRGRETGNAMRTARGGKRGARNVMRDAEGVAQTTRDRTRGPESAMHGTRCAVQFAEDAPLIPPTPPREAGHRSPAPQPPTPSPVGR
jgi:hypothetical protein